MPKWINTEEQKPNDGQKIIAHDPWNAGSWYDTYVNNQLASGPNTMFDKWKPCNHHRINGECVNQKG